MSSKHDEIVQACQKIITNKLLDAEVVKARIGTIASELTDWACDKAICETDVLWDMIEKLRKISEK